MVKLSIDHIEMLQLAKDYLMSFRDDFVNDPDYPNESATIDAALCDAIYSTDYVLNMMGERI